jgi:hypothetical protein
MRAAKALTICFAALVAGDGLANDQPTSPTHQLRLGDLFAVQPGTAVQLPPQPTYNLGGPVLILPDTDTWRLPPATPSPTPTPLVEDLPDMKRAPQLIEEATKLRQEVRRPAFRSTGRILPPKANGLAEVRLSTEVNTLRIRYTLQPSDDAEPIILLHTPGSADRFMLPPGEWQLVLSAWQADRPQLTIERRFMVQRLDRDQTYTFTFDRDFEQDVKRELRR